jgi:hypothetical protein
MEKAKRARKAETPRQPSLSLRLRAPYLYPDHGGSGGGTACAAPPCPLPVIASEGKMAKECHLLPSVARRQGDCDSAGHWKVESHGDTRMVATRSGSTKGRQTGSVLYG